MNPTPRPQDDSSSGSPHPGTAPRRPGWLTRRRLQAVFPVRARLTLSMAVLTSLALLTAGVVIWTLESRRLSADAVDAATTEVSALRRYAQDPVDPATGKRYGSAEEVLRAFMNRNTPGPDQMLALWTTDSVPLVTVSPRRKVVTEQSFLDAVRPLASTGGSTQVRTTRGEVLLTVQPVVGTTGPEAALVVVTFLDDERESLRDLMRTYAIVSGLALLLITGLAAWQSRRLLRPLGDLAEAAREISESDLSRRVPESGNDDITALTRTVNAMLDRLERAFADQRQFIDDAGHELRTPLTVLGGHLELLDPDDPAEVEATRALLLDEVDRMSRLVNDLILLTKSQRPDFVTPGPVLLPDLVASVLAKSRPLADRDWRLDAAPDVQVSADEQRLTQALLQLVDNAVKHTDAGDTIAVGASVTAGRCRLWVRDSGDGIPAEQREAVLERFTRAHVRPQDEGFGLGLSIVAAIARAHAGRVIIEDTPGGGATVIIELALEEETWPAS